MTAWDGPNGYLKPFHIETPHPDSNNNRRIPSPAEAPNEQKQKKQKKQTRFDAL